MNILKGTPAGTGIKMGRAVVIPRPAEAPVEKTIDPEDVGKERRRLKKALSRSRAQIKSIISGIRSENNKHFEVLKAYLMMLDDAKFSNAVGAMIEEARISAEAAVLQTAKELKEPLTASKDPYLRSRAEDLDFVATRVILNLRGLSPDPPLAKMRGSIVVAHKVSPANFARMVNENITGLALETGGVTSHTSIIAKALAIPSLLGVFGACDEIKTDDMLIIDCFRGILIVNPDEETINRYVGYKVKYDAFERSLFEEISLPAETKDGFRMRLCGNIDRIDEIERLHKNGAEGISLVRTEFLFMGAREPEESELAAAYREIVEKMRGLPVTFRTLDAGGDKTPKYMMTAREENPALGVRGLRASLANPSSFKRQLRAMLAASAFGPVKIMFPMVTGAEDFRLGKSVVEEAMAELEKEGRAFDKKIKIGAMIETPAAALSADILAREADFFSLGTNDLIQYSLAIDRNNEFLRGFYKPLHISVLRLIKMTAEAAQNAGIEFSVCGETASEPIYAPLFAAFGAAELGMSARSVPYVRRMTRSITLNRARDLLARALSCEDAAAIEELIKEEIGEKYPELCYNNFDFAR